MAQDKRWGLVPPFRFDTDKIEQLISFPQAFEQYTGQRYVERKNIKCFEAANHTNGDKKPSMHCYPDHCRCFACGKTYDIYGLAARSRGLDVKRDFKAVCEALCEDFGLDVYAVSNKGERDAMMEQLFHKKEKQEYREYFPLSQKELEAVGLFDSNGRQEVKYPVNAEDYYCYFNNCLPEELPERLKKRCTDENGKPVMIQATHGECVDMGIFPSTYSQGKVENGHDYLPVHRIQDLWKQDKALAETMIMDKAYEMAERIDILTARLRLEISNYEQTHDMKAEAEFAQGYIDTIGKSHPQLTTPQKERLAAYFDYKSDIVKLETYRDMLCDIERVSDKINSLLMRRAQHESEQENEADRYAPPNNLPE